MIEITERDFDKEVLQCKLPVFTCFTTNWCQSCYGTCLFAGQLSSEYNERVKFVKLDKEKSPAIAERYHVIVVPTILVFQNALIVNRLIGFQARSSLRSLINNLLDGNETTT